MLAFIDSNDRAQEECNLPTLLPLIPKLGNRDPEPPSITAGDIYDQRTSRGFNSHGSHTLDNTEPRVLLTWNRKATNSSCPAVGVTKTQAAQGGLLTSPYS